MSDEQKRIDPEFFAAHVKRWQEINKWLSQHESNFHQVPKLPDVSDRLGREFQQLAPLLNEGIAQMARNFGMGAAATEQFADALIQSARSYGMNEEEAAALSRGMI